MTNNLQIEIDTYTKERGWDDNHPANIAKSILIEASELLENWQWNHNDVKEIKKDTETFQNIKDELGDVLIYCIELASRLDLDYEVVAREKLEKVKEKYNLTALEKTGGTTKEIKRAHRKMRGK